jgi:hypothetical protein
MPPVIHGAPSTETDSEATAELPVLDVAAYEASLDDSNAHTDTWVMPAGATTTDGADATVQMPAIKSDSIPTLRPADSDDTSALDLSGTHEMPALPKHRPKISARNPEPESIERAPAAEPEVVFVPPSPPHVEELRSALANAERRIEELTERARIADVERGVAVARANAECAQLREQLELQLESLHTARGRVAAKNAEQPALEDELFARADRIAALERELGAQRRVLEANLTSLAAAQQRCEALECDLANARAGIARRDTQIAMIEADMRARQEREASLEARLSVALAASEPHVPRLRADIAVLQERVDLLTQQLAEATSRNAERDQDLEVAEESLRHLEIEVRDKSGKLSEANVTVEEWRAVIAESQRSIQQRDSRIQQLEAELERRAAAIEDSTSHTSEEVALEGPARVLIRTNGNTEFVHVLGRRTRIGRGSDNELVLDTKHVSRYHAVLLAGPVHTTIEDLNSTNGVFVNGKRVSRQALKDGDKVTIGRSQFRYTVRG